MNKCTGAKYACNKETECQNFCTEIASSDIGITTCCELSPSPEQPVQCKQRIDKQCCNDGDCKPFQAPQVTPPPQLSDTGVVEPQPIPDPTIGLDPGVDPWAPGSEGTQLIEREALLRDPAFSVEGALQRLEDYGNNYFGVSDSQLPVDSSGSLTSDGSFFQSLNQSLGQLSAPPLDFGSIAPNIPQSFVPGWEYTSAGFMQTGSFAPPSGNWFTNTASNAYSWGQGVASNAWQSIRQGLGYGPSTDVTVGQDPLQEAVVSRSDPNWYPDLSALAGDQFAGGQPLSEPLQPGGVEQAIADQNRLNELAANSGITFYDPSGEELDVPVSMRTGPDIDENADLRTITRQFQEQYFGGLTANPLDDQALTLSDPYSCPQGSCIDINLPLAMAAFDPNTNPMSPMDFSADFSVPQLSLNEYPYTTADIVAEIDNPGPVGGIGQEAADLAWENLPLRNAWESVTGFISPATAGDRAGAIEFSYIGDDGESYVMSVRSDTPLGPNTTRTFADIQAARVAIGEDPNYITESQLRSLEGRVSGLDVDNIPISYTRNDGGELSTFNTTLGERLETLKGLDVEIAGPGFSELVAPPVIEGEPGGIAGPPPIQNTEPSLSNRQNPLAVGSTGFDAGPGGSGFGDPMGDNSWQQPSAPGPLSNIPVAQAPLPAPGGGTPAPPPAPSGDVPASGGSAPGGIPDIPRQTFPTFAQQPSPFIQGQTGGCGILCSLGQGLTAFNSGFGISSAAAAQPPGQARPPSGTQVLPLITRYAPGAGGNVEGPWAAAMPNLEGETIPTTVIRNGRPTTVQAPVPRTLDDLRLWRESGGLQGHPYITLASAPENFGRFYNMGIITYRSPIDEQEHILENVIGYVHDTGSAFRQPTYNAAGEMVEANCLRYNSCAIRQNKFDIAIGDFRGWSAEDGAEFVNNEQPLNGTSQRWQNVSASNARNYLAQVRAQPPAARVATAPTAPPSQPAAQPARTPAAPQPAAAPPAPAAQPSADTLETAQVRERIRQAQSDRDAAQRRANMLGSVRDAITSARRLVRQTEIGLGVLNNALARWSYPDQKGIDTIDRGIVAASRIAADLRAIGANLNKLPSRLADYARRAIRREGGATSMAEEGKKLVAEVKVALQDAEERTTAAQAASDRAIADAEQRLAELNAQLNGAQPASSQVVQANPAPRTLQAGMQPLPVPSALASLPPPGEVAPTATMPAPPQASSGVENLVDRVRQATDGQGTVIAHNITDPNKPYAVIIPSSHGGKLSDATGQRVEAQRDAMLSALSPGATRGEEGILFGDSGLDGEVGIETTNHVRNLILEDFYHYASRNFSDARNLTGTANQFFNRTLERFWQSDEYNKLTRLYGGDVVGSVQSQTEEIIRSIIERGSATAGTENITRILVDLINERTRLTLGERNVEIATNIGRHLESGRPFVVAVGTRHFHDVSVPATPRSPATIAASLQRRLAEEGIPYVMVVPDAMPSGSMNDIITANHAAAQVAVRNQVASNSPDSMAPVEPIGTTAVVPSGPDNRPSLIPSPIAPPELLRPLAEVAVMGATYVRPVVEAVQAVWQWLKDWWYGTNALPTPEQLAGMNFLNGGEVPAVPADVASGPAKVDPGAGAVPPVGPAAPTGPAGPAAPRPGVERPGGSLPPIVTPDGPVPSRAPSFNLGNLLGGIGNILQGLALFNGAGSGYGSGYYGQQQYPYPPQPPLVMQPVPTAPTQPGATTTLAVLRPSLALVASPNSIPVDGTSRLTWTALRATECEIRYENGVILARGGATGTSTTPSLKQTTSFALTCGGDNGTRSATTTVYVGEKPPASAGSQTSTPAPTITATTGTGGATSAAPASSGSSQPQNNWCDPGTSIDAFITCMQALPGAAPPLY